MFPIWNVLGIYSSTVFLSSQPFSLICIPQYPVSGRRLDLALVSKNIKIDIEVDSDRYHRNPDGSRKMDDTWRDIQLMGKGWKVMRFWVYNLRDNMEKCVSEIEKAWRKHE